jgi:hypothetical protein
MAFNLRIIRPLDIYDKKASFLLNQIMNFLGEREVLAKFERIKQIYDFEKGPIYREYYLDKKYSFWNSLVAFYKYNKSGHSFKRALNYQFFESLMIACYIKNLYKSFSPSKIIQLRNVILKSESIQPHIFELQIAASLWKYGFEIDWSEEENNKRIPEFTAKNKGISIEVECKSKNINTGRQILREDFYRLSDGFFNKINLIDDFCGIVSLKIPNRLPSNQSLRKIIVNKLIEICKNSHKGSKKIFIESEFTVQIEHEVEKGEDIIEGHLKKIQSENPALPFLVFYAWKNKNNEQKWIILKLESKSEDKVVEKIIDEIKDGMKQSSGNSSSIICCYIPEISSFNGLEENSALKNATNRLFNEKKSNFLWGVIYFSDFQINKVNNFHLQSTYPMISFSNPYYSKDNYIFQEFIEKISMP